LYFADADIGNDSEAESNTQTTAETESERLTEAENDWLSVVDTDDASLEERVKDSETDATTVNATPRLDEIDSCSEMDATMLRVADTESDSDSVDANDCDTDKCCTHHDSYTDIVKVSVTCAPLGMFMPLLHIRP